MIENGQPAPEFTLPDATGSDVSLSDSAGAWRVLYFYPRASTPGCTTQACSIRDRASEYAERGAVVIGVSPDPVSAVAKFAGKHDLEFTLLADEDHVVCDAYGVWGEKQMAGNKFFGATRATFLIDPAGIVRHVIPKVSPKTHDDEVLAKLDELVAS